MTNKIKNHQKNKGDFVKLIQQLQKNENNRYELINGVELHCGDVIDIFIFEKGQEEGKWVKVSIEHNGNDYYAVGYKNLCLQGLWARVEK